MKVYIERINLQVELIRYREIYRISSYLLLRSDGFRAISPTERIAGTFERKFFLFWRITRLRLISSLLDVRSLSVASRARQF